MRPRALTHSYLKRMGYREWLEEVTGLEEYEMPYGTNSFVNPHAGNVRETNTNSHVCRWLTSLALLSQPSAAPETFFIG